MLTTTHMTTRRIYLIATKSLSFQVSPCLCRRGKVSTSLPSVFVLTAKGLMFGTLQLKEALAADGTPLAASVTDFLEACTNEDILGGWLVMQNLQPFTFRYRPTLF